MKWGGKEKYELTWPGKRQAKVTANTPTTNTLRPVKEKSVDFDNTQNIYIEGDNLEALKILQESYLGKIKCIYIDPPYNTGNDFIYKDNFNKGSKGELEESGQVDDEGNRLVKNADSSGRYHSDWLSMMYPRLKLARNLLSDEGVIFISIDDNEQENLKKICDEVFGESNFIGQLIHQRAKGGGQAKYIVRGHDYILVYAKKVNEKLMFKREKVVQQKVINIDGKKYLKNDDVIRKTFGKYDNNLNDRRCFYEEVEKYKGLGKKKEIDNLIKNGKLFLEKNKFGMHTICEYIPLSSAYSKLYSIVTVMSEKGKEELNKIGLPLFDYPKPSQLIKLLIKSVTYDDSKGIVLDFFSGSATTAHAIMELNAKDNGKRNFIMIQLPEVCEEKVLSNGITIKNICDLGEECIRRAANKIKEENGLLANNLDLGFRVYKLDSSNMKDVYYKPNDIDQVDLTDLASNIKEDRTAEDLLTQVILDLGLTLDLKIEEKKIKNNNVFFVADNALVACFDDEIDMEIVDEICKCSPLKLVLKDSSFKEDSDKINLEEKIKKLSPETEIKVL